MEEIKSINQHHNKSEFIIVMGGVCSGKTTHRRKLYSEGYSSIDAGDIFIQLSQGNYYDFPSHLEGKMNEIGLNKMRESIKNYNSIVIELVGADYGIVQEVIDLVEKLNYSLKIDYLECDMEEAWRRNVNRGNDNISAHFCEPFHIMWVKQVAIEFLNSGNIV